MHSVKCRKKEKKRKRERHGTWIDSGATGGSEGKNKNVQNSSFLPSDSR